MNLGEAEIALLSVFVHKQRKSGEFTDSTYVTAVILLYLLWHFIPAQQDWATNVVINSGRMYWDISPGKYPYLSFEDKLNMEKKYGVFLDEDERLDPKYLSVYGWAAFCVVYHAVDASRYCHKSNPISSRRIEGVSKEIRNSVPEAVKLVCDGIDSEGYLSLGMSKSEIDAEVLKYLGKKYKSQYLQFSSDYIS